MFDPRVLTSTRDRYTLSSEIFFLNLVVGWWNMVMLSRVGSGLGCVFAGQRGCATFLFVAPLYIVEGLFKAPPLYRLEGFQPESLASLGASLGDRVLSEVAHSPQVVRSRWLI